MALVMESDDNEKDRADGILLLSVAVLLSMLWCLSRPSPTVAPLRLCSIFGRPTSLQDWKEQDWNWDTQILVGTLLITCLGLSFFINERKAWIDDHGSDF